MSTNPSGVSSPTQITGFLMGSPLEAPAATKPIPDTDRLRLSEVPLFPPELCAREGDQTNYGPAVSALKLALNLLSSLHFIDTSDLPTLEVNKTYDEVTTSWVKRLQEHLKGCEIDGHFGPVTRQRFAKVVGYDLAAIPLIAFKGDTMWSKAEGRKTCWRLVQSAPEPADDVSF